MADTMNTYPPCPSSPSSGLLFLRRLASERGAIVSSADCSEMEIAFARRENRFWVDPETSYGYVLRLKEWREQAEKALNVIGIPKIEGGGDDYAGFGGTD